MATTARLGMVLLEEAQQGKVLGIDAAMQILDAAVAALALANAYTARNDFTQAPDASADHAVVNIGSAGFAGGGGTNFAGSASGTLLGFNAASGFTGNLADLQLGGASKFKVASSGLTTWAEAANLVFGTTTGTKIGTATTQKLGFWNKAPVVQPAAYTVTNPTTDRALNVTADTLPQVAQVLGTLLADLQSIGLIG